MSRILKKTYFLALLLVVVTGTQIFAQDLQNAIALTRSEQFSAAGTVYRKLIEKDPNNGDTYFWYGTSFLRKYYTDTVNNSLIDMCDSAKRIYDIGINHDHNNPLNYVGLGTIAMVKDDLPGVQVQFSKVFSLLPSKTNKTIVLAPEKHSLVLVRMAAAYILTRHNDTANVFSMLRTAEKLDNKNPDLFIVKGDAYIYLLNDGSKAIANYNIAQSLDPKSPEAKLRVGQLWMRARQYQYALDTYQEVVKIDPDFAPAYRELGYLYSRANRNTEAEAAYKKFLELSAHNTYARIQYINVLLDQKKFQEALVQINEVFRVDTTNIDLYRAAAYSYFETGQYDKGLVAAKKFFKRAKPEKVRPTDYAYLGRLLAKNKQDSSAYVTLLQAFQLDSTKSDLLSEAAMSCNRMKKYDKALEIYDLKIRLKKASPADYYNMGKVYYNLQSWKMVDSVLSYYLTLMPEHIQAYQWRARALVNLDPETKEGLAKPVWETLVPKLEVDSVKYAKDLQEAYEYLAFYYFKQYNITKEQDNGRKAIEFSRKIQAIDPENEKAKVILKELTPKIKL